MLVGVYLTAPLSFILMQHVDADCASTAVVRETRFPFFFSLHKFDFESYQGMKQ